MYGSQKYQFLYLSIYDAKIIAIILFISLTALLCSYYKSQWKKLVSIVSWSTQ